MVVGDFSGLRVVGAHDRDLRATIARFGEEVGVGRGELKARLRLCLQGSPAEKLAIWSAGRGLRRAVVIRPGGSADEHWAIRARTFKP